MTNGILQMLLLADGFDQYGDTPTMSLAYTVLGDCFQCVNRNPRTGSGSLTWRQGATNADYCQRFLPSNASQIYMGFAINFQTLLDTFNSNNYFTFDILDDLGNIQIQMQITALGELNFFRGSNNQIIKTSFRLTPKKYSYLEIGLKIDPVSGVLEVRVDGDKQAIFVGNTQNGTGLINSIRFTGVRVFGTPDFDIDDLYLCDPIGITFNNFLGPVHMRTLLPTADTTNSDWTITGAVSGNAAVGLIPPNIGARYIQATAVGNETDFTYPNIPATAYAIYGVLIGAFVQQSVASGISTMSLGLNSNGVTSDSIPLTPPNVGRFLYQLFSFDPEQGAQWITKKVNLVRTRLIRTT